MHVESPLDELRHGKRDVALGTYVYLNAENRRSVLRMRTLAPKAYFG